MKKLLFTVALLAGAACAQSTTLPNLGLCQPDLGSNGWGACLNTSLGILDSMGGGNVLVPKFNIQALAFNGGTTLTGVSGSGTQLMTNTGPSVSTLTVNTAVGCGTGIKHQNVDSCTTGTSGVQTCDTTLTWCGSSFANTNYELACSFGVNTFNYPYIQLITKSADHIVITTSNVISPGSAAHGNITCIAME